MSGNGRYLFVGAPGENKIYSYTLVTIPTSSAKVFTITSTGSAGSYTLDFTTQLV